MIRVFSKFSTCRLPATGMRSALCIPDEYLSVSRFGAALV
ncbi:hypothetical protein C7S14_1937 [Burkholderia cepacia]|nr:hypothetical protein C7S14_1937 [Burkholderia cepacia]